MKKLSIGLALAVSLCAQAQQITDTKRNLVKMNVTGLLFKNFQFAYERTFTKMFGLQVSYGFIPAGEIPFIKQFIKDDEVSNIKLGGSNFTIEPRIYLGKGYGHGFYLAPYYRYSHYNVDNFVYDYTPDNSSSSNNIPVQFTGKTNANSAGLMIGAQWLLGKTDKWVLDVWFIGAHYGGATGTIDGRSSRVLTPSEQAQLQKDLENLDIPLVDYKVQTNANGASISLDSNWLGIRSGLSFGYRF